jgi:hypothetical protein
MQDSGDRLAIQLTEEGVVAGEMVKWAINTASPKVARPFFAA